jgi:hypothetical protein
MTAPRDLVRELPDESAQLPPASARVILSRSAAIAIATEPMPEPPMVMTSRRALP